MKKAKQQKKQKKKNGRFGDLTGSRGVWTLKGRNEDGRKVAVKVKLVDHYTWRGVRFLVVTKA